MTASKKMSSYQFNNYTSLKVIRNAFKVLSQHGMVVRCGPIGGERAGALCQGRCLPSIAPTLKLHIKDFCLKGLLPSSTSQ